MSEITFLPFDNNKALNGAAVGWNVDGTPEPASCYQRVNATLFSYVIRNVVYYCDSTGAPIESGNQLYILNLSVPETQGTASTRGDGSVVYIETLEPRETMACYAMMGLLASHKDAMSMDNFQMGIVVDKAFQLAQIMMYEAGRLRAESGAQPGDKEEIDLDPGLLTSTTDKLLYNIGVGLDNLTEKVTETGLKVVTTAEAPLNVALTDGSKNVVVTGVGDGVTVPVSVQGTVSTSAVDTTSVRISSVSDGVVVPVSVENTPTVVVQESTDEGTTTE